MHCPSCDLTTTLNPVKLKSELPAWECAECKGLLIDLLAYRAWRDEWPHDEAPAASVTEVADNARALLCPKCDRVMLKFRIGPRLRNTIDVCTHCDEAWLDQGEWELLGALALQSKLTNIFTQPWQRRVAAEQAEAAQAARYESLVGKDAVSRINEFLDWLENHPKRHDLARILNGRLR